MPNAQTVPILPCISLDETLTFYRSLGFGVTYQQTRPYVYAATRRGDVHLHFVGIAKLQPSQNYGACLVVVAELDTLHATFRDSLTALYGKVPLKGFPRITRYRSGASRFTVVDVAGNSVVWVKRDAPESHDTPSTTPLGKALAQARRLRDSKNDDVMAAKLLDVALRKHVDATAFDRALALAVRVEIATAQDDQPSAAAARAELETLPLNEDERERVRAELGVHTT
jgi:hypothetical protein